MQDLKQVFDYMKDVSFPYVVLRNWEGLPDLVELGEHSDLDLLVYDFEHWKELFPDAVQVYPSPRVQFKIPLNGGFVQADIRHVGDGYYPQRLEKLILETREWNSNGFFIPTRPLFGMALAYHCVHHKNLNNYPKHLGDTSIEELLKALQESDLGWVEPSDPTVGRFNSYLKGATAVVEKKDGKIIKKQTNYTEFPLMENEQRILKICDSKHFPKVYALKGQALEIEDCGEELTMDNLPKDWKAQFIEVITDLRKYNIKHRDIRPDNLMVKDGVIKLIDFGWARLESDPEDNAPKCLGIPYRASWGPDDNFAMMKVIKEFEYKEEEKRLEKNP